MRPDATNKLAATAPKASMSRAIIGSVIAGLVIAGVVVAILIGNSSKAPDSGSDSSALPAGVVGGNGGGILANAATVKNNAPTLEIYSDYQCDLCGQFEKVMGNTLAELAKAGDTS